MDRCRQAINDWAVAQCGAHTYQGNPYDGHTMDDQLVQAIGNRTADRHMGRSRLNEQFCPDDSFI